MSEVSREFTVRLYRKANSMIEATAAFVPGQGHVRMIVSRSAPETIPTEWETCPPSTTPLVIEVRGDWKPTHPTQYPGVSTFGMPKREAATLAVSLNRREIARQKTRPDTERQTAWHLVILTKFGFAVVKLHVLNWRPETPFDLPPDQWPLSVPNMPCRCAAKEFNQRQLEAAGAPRYWCLSVKRLTVADLLSDEEVEGGVA